jgi:hypothetical protein
MANDEKGWAVGQLGLILRTEDGGKTWTHQPTVKEAQGVHLFSVQALDENRAWAVGEWGTRLFTDDGGQTWQDLSLTVDETHPQFVWLSIADQERVRTGKKVFEDVGLNDVHCLSSNTQYCWMIGEFGYLFRSEDGGTHWEFGDIISGVVVDPIQLGYNEIEIDEEAKEKIREFALQIADQQHLNVAIEPRVSAREMKNFGSEDDPFPLFDIIEARTQEVVATVEGVGILSDRIRRRGAPPWDYEDFLEDDPEFLRRYLDSRLSDQPQIEVALAQNPYLFTVRFADENNGLISGLGGMIRGRRTHLALRGRGSQAGPLLGPSLSEAGDCGGREGADPRLRRRRRQLGASRQRLPDHLHIHARHQLQREQPGRLHRRSARYGAAQRGWRGHLEAGPPGYGLALAGTLLNIEFCLFE